MKFSSLYAPKKTAVIKKEVVARVHSRFAPVYLVNEYPKSGGTWLKFMLAEALGVPAWTKGAPQWAPCVMQAHWYRKKGGCRTVALVRDGRDVMVSFYFHAFFRNEFQNEALLRVMEQKCSVSDREDIRSNLLPFMKTLFSDPVSPAFTWRDFVRQWATRSDVVLCRYEDLRWDTAGELARVCWEVNGTRLEREHARAIADAYSMDNMRKRKAELNPGVTGKQTPEKSFIRQGSVGGWSEFFTDEALQWFEREAGAELEMLGYLRGRPEAQK